MSNLKLRTLFQQSKFLIIDDFENFRTSLRLMLVSFGAASVESASSAEDALNKIKYESFDVILCDFNLGSGKNGQQVLEEMRLNKSLRRTHLFVMISADTSKDTVLGAREFQPDAYIAKPVTRNGLEERLAQLLMQQRALKPINTEIDLENYAKAISLCKHEIDSGSRYRSWCLQTMADLYRKLGDTSNAKQVYREILAQRPIDWAKIGLGRTLYDANQYDEAKSLFSAVVKGSPFMVEAYEGISDSCLKLGQKKEAQEALVKAVNLSPRMVTRQKKLAKLCMDNNDLLSAADAFRHAVTFGMNTVHENSDLYLDFGRCLTDLSETEEPRTSTDYSAEANQQLDIVLDRYSSEQEACHCANLVKARLFFRRGDKERADLLIEEVNDLVSKETMSVDLGVELSKTLHACGHAARAEQLLIFLAQRFEHDPTALANIEAMLDEPEPLTIRFKAKDLNKEGIHHFENGKLAEAVKVFKSAVELTPKHAALNLNLAQVALRLYRDNKDRAMLALANECIDRINHIPKQHKQYRRLKHISNTLEKYT